MARTAKTVRRERFSVNLCPNIARLLRAAARNDNSSLSHYLESSLIEALAKGRRFDEEGMLQPTIRKQGIFIK